MNTLLVTGGAGFIGSCFVRLLLADQDTRIINLDKLTYSGNLESLGPALHHPRHVFVQGDISDRDLVGRLLRSYRPSALVHFAAESHVDRSIDGPRQFLVSNTVGTFELLSATREWWDTLHARERRNFRFLNVSTDEVYGSLGDTGRFTEESPPAPSSPYSASKASADHFARAFHRTYGLPVLISRCSNNYGPYQFPEKLIPLMIRNALAGQPLPVYGDGGQVRDWLFVEDHCRALLAILEEGRPGEVYNVGGNSERTNLEVVHAVCDLVDRLKPGLPHAPCSSLIRFVADRPGHDRRYSVDASKIQTELGWAPQVPFEEGLERTVRWYLDNPDWVEGITSGKYQGERLGLPGG
jgi:dTDP-glucose 4,6-dehydratase